MVTKEQVDEAVRLAIEKGIMIRYDNPKSRLTVEQRHAYNEGVRAKMAALSDADFAEMMVELRKA